MGYRVGIVFSQDSAFRLDLHFSEENKRRFNQRWLSQFDFISAGPCRVGAPDVLDTADAQLRRHCDDRLMTFFR